MTIPRTVDDVDTALLRFLARLHAASAMLQLDRVARIQRDIDALLDLRLSMSR